ncbi:MAG: fimbrillin family protein [Prevotella sp.]|nr:fimbrillin family protein [Prevotella sp.]
MKKSKMIYLLMAGALMTACSSDNAGQEQTGRVPISLGYTTAEVQTRANDNLNPTNITSGEAVKVLIKKNSETWGSSTAYDNAGYDYTAGAGGAMSAPTTPPTYPTDGTSVDMIAYYPATAATTFVVSNTQTDDATGNANYKASDLLVSSPVINQFRTPEKVNLQLYHKMAKIIIKLQAGTLSLDKVNAVKLVNVKRQVTFTPTTGAISAATSASGTDPDEITISVSDDPGSAAVFPPQTINGTLVELTTTEGTATYSVINKTFEAGHQYTTTITVNSSAIGIQNAITDWTVEAAETGYTDAPQNLAELTEWINYYGTLATPQPEKYSPYLGWYVKSDGTISSSSTDAIGRIAYMSTSDVDTSIPGSRILVLGTSDIGTYAWKSANSSGEDAWNDESKYNGYEFTANHNSSTYPAAYQARNLSTNRPSGASSWFLPSKAQWTAMLPVSSSLSMSTTGGYWTATEVNSNNQDAWDYQFGTPTWSAGSKMTQHNVRACFAYPYNIVVLNAVTSGNIGWLIASDGNAYPDMNSVKLAMKSPVAMIAYSGDKNGIDGQSSYTSTYNHGLAIALDFTGPITSWEVANGDASVERSAANYESVVAHPSGTSTWFLASAYQWQRIFIACNSSSSFISTLSDDPTLYNDGDINTMMIDCGGRAMWTGNSDSFYWTSTTKASNTTYAWAYYFGYSTASYQFRGGLKTYSAAVRPVLAF